MGAAGFAALAGGGFATDFFADAAEVLEVAVLAFAGVAFAFTVLAAGFAAGLAGLF